MSRLLGRRRVRTFSIGFASRRAHPRPAARRPANLGGRRLIDEHAASRADHSPKIWTLLTLETWLRSLRTARAASTGKEPREARVHG
jgi:hypothetical protein